MQYHISFKEPHKHYLNIEYTINEVHTKEIIVLIPAWRPGRYELQNFAANIRSFAAFDSKGKKLHFEKITRNSWKIFTTGISDILVQYDYYACKMDAGGCWLDEEQLYLNFIGCMLYVKDRENEACQISLHLPEDYKIACGLPQKNNVLYAEDFYHLADSPMIASANIHHKIYSAAGIDFHIWVQGDFLLDWETVLADFKKFSEIQISIMNDFPEEEYHFLFQLLPYKHYHGVEHRNSTVVTLGPAIEMNSKANYLDLLGISSHELFHSWNIIKIRPTEMMPYDFSKENYFKTGFVAEGFTTYYGDLFLVRSGIISTAEYFEELNTTFKRHFENFGNYHLSLADSSFDLWIDGYTSGIPNRKVSIYVKGCVASLILDLEIRKACPRAKSLDDLMLYLWQEFGKKKKGYTQEDIIQSVKKIAGVSFQPYFEECIYGTTDLKDRLNAALNFVGCTLEISDSESMMESLYGARIIQIGYRVIVESIEPGSPADAVLSKDDEINMEFSGLLGLSKDNTELELPITRYGKKKIVKIIPDGKKYFKQYKIVKNIQATDEAKSNFADWTGQEF